MRLSEPASVVTAWRQTGLRSGEEGLTFRALATRLATGPGAIYWHITNKDELLFAASDVIVARALADIGAGATPRAALVGIALAVFETVDAHPRAGTQLVCSPPPRAMLQIVERIGRQVQALRVPADAQFTAATVLGSYIMPFIRKVANQLRDHDDRAEFLAGIELILAGVAARSRRAR